MTLSCTGKKIALISAGDRFTVATTVDNEVYSWGYRNHGRLGDGINNELGNRLVTCSLRTEKTLAV